MLKSRISKFHLPLLVSVAMLNIGNVYASVAGDDEQPGAPSASSSSSTSLLRLSYEAKIDALSLTPDQKQQTKKQIKEKQDLLYDILSQTMEVARKANYITTYGTPMDEIDVNDIIFSLEKGLDIRFSENVVYVNNEIHTYTTPRTFQARTSFSIEGYTVSISYGVHKMAPAWAILLPPDMSVIKPSSNRTR